MPCLWKELKYNPQMGLTYMVLQLLGNDNTKLDSRYLSYALTDGYKAFVASNRWRYSSCATWTTYCYSTLGYVHVECKERERA